jgi:hypothetical protein
LQPFPAAELEAIAARVIDEASRDEPTSSTAGMFLLRHYLATGRDELRELLAIALARALASAAEAASAVERAAWLTLLVEATAIADDNRIVETMEALAAALAAAWPSAAGLGDGVAAIDACLQASSVVEARDIVPAAIDELERVVGSAYRPGRGLVDLGSGDRASSADHVRTSSALLTAFEITGRLPYSMLAEELMQIAGRTLAASDDFATHCAAARVFCRLAALHDAAEYRAAAVIASDADYRSDARQILDAQAPRVAAASTADAALYGVALRELLSLR